MADISYQLYSSRDFPPFARTLKMLKELGYAEVEGYGALYEDPAALAAALKAAGLVMASGHFGLDMLEEEGDRVVAIARATGMEAVYCPYVDSSLRPTDGAGWRAFGRRLQEAGKRVRDAGLAFGWHNHDFEFRRQADGSMPMEEILSAGPDLSWEADIAWIARGGADPLEWISRHGARISAAHIKDIAPAGECLDEDGWADVGQGTMDWPRIWRALEATPCRRFVIEHDRPADDRRFASRSIAAVRQF